MIFEKKLDFLSKFDISMTKSYAYIMHYARIEIAQCHNATKQETAQLLWTLNTSSPTSSPNGNSAGLNSDHMVNTLITWLVFWSRGRYSPSSHKRSLCEECLPALLPDSSSCRQKSETQHSIHDFELTYFSMELEWYDVKSSKLLDVTQKNHVGEFTKIHSNLG